MQIESRKYLFDMQEAARLAVEFTSEKDLTAYRKNPMLRFAVERALGIIGEALVQLTRLHPEVAEKISNARSIIAFRNILVHAYAQVDDRIVWDVVQTHLPILIREVDALMSSEP